MGTWFEIQINKSGTDLLISARGSGHREVPQRLLGRGFDVTKILGFGEAVQRAANHGRALPDGVLETARAIGQAILDGDIGNMWARLAESANGPLLLRLNIGDPELQKVPWEAVCLPGQAFGFWATSPDLYPVRRVTTTEPWQPREITGALRILAIAPTDTSTLKNLRDALESRIASGEVEWLDPIVGEAARAKYLFERLRRKPTPHVIHFLGHGAFRDNVPALRLGNEDNEEKWVPVELIAQQIKSNFRDDLRLVVLEACEGAATSGFASAAEILARSGADGVVAHLWPVRADVARTYSQQLYLALTETERMTGDIARAVNEARRSLFVIHESSAQTFSPVIYLRGPDGEIFDFKSHNPPPPPDTRDKPDQPNKRPPPPTPGQSPQWIPLALLHCELDVDDAQNSLNPEEIVEVLHKKRSAFRDICQSEVRALEGMLVEGEGGGFFARFGHPNAHEDDSVRAVRAALRIIDATRVISQKSEDQLGVGLVVRAGIHAGRMMASAQGVAEANVGVVPQIALMLQQAATSNCVFVSQELCTLVDGFFELVDRGEQSSGLGRKQVRVRAFEVLRGLPERSTSVHRLSRMIGRQHEAALIMERWESARKGRGAVVLVSADAGIGKSRLVREIQDGVKTSNHRRLECACSPYHENTALYPVLVMLGQALGFDAGMTADQLLARLVTVLKEVNVSPEEYAGVIAEILELPAPSEAVALPPKRKRDLLLEGTTAIFCALAEKSPVLLVIADLHWMDPSTSEWLQYLFDQIVEFPMLVLASTRPKYTPPAAWSKSAHFTPIHLTRLDRQEMLEHILEITGGKRLPVEIVDDLIAKADGYPLFVEALTRMVIESNMVENRNGAYVLVEPFRSLSIPAKLQESLMTRLASLDGALHVAQVGAVIGREFTVAVHVAVSGSNETEVKSGLDILVERGVVVRRGLLGRSRYVFTHALVQQALYESMTSAERRRFHQRTAEVIEKRFPDVYQRSPELLAHHFTQSGVADKSLQYWTEAAQQSIARHADVETLRHTAKALQALAKLPPGEKRDELELDLQHRQCPALVAIKGWAAPEYVAALERAQQLNRGRYNKYHLGITVGLFGYYLLTAKLARALEFANELMAVAQRENSLDYRLEANARACDVWFWLGRHEKAREYGLACLKESLLARDHMRFADAHGDDPSAVSLCYVPLSLWLMGRVDEAQQLHELAKKELPRYTHRFSHGFVLNGLAWYGCHTGQPHIALEWGEKLKTLAIDHEFTVWHAEAQGHIGWARGMMGEVDEGLQMIRAGLALWHASRGVVASMLNSLFIVEVCRHAGRLPEALSVVESTLEEAEYGEERHCLPELLRHHGELWVAIHGERELEKARVEIGKALLMAIEQQAVAYELRAAMSLASIGGAKPAPSDLAAIQVAMDKFQPGSDTPDLKAAKALFHST